NTPAQVQVAGPPKDWSPKNYCLRVPQVVFISIVPDVTIFADQMSIRSDYPNPVWGSPEPLSLTPVQTDFLAVPWTNYGVGRSLSGGITNVGWHGLGTPGFPGRPRFYFNNSFDMRYN